MSRTGLQDISLRAEKGGKMRCKRPRTAVRKAAFHRPEGHVLKHNIRAVNPVILISDRKNNYQNVIL